LKLNGAELIIVPKACGLDDVRPAGLKTGAFESLVGVAMANYPTPVLKLQAHIRAHFVTQTLDAFSLQKLRELVG
jgi:hypothetical protein